MTKKEVKIFKKIPTLAPKITLNSKLVSWRQNEMKANQSQFYKLYAKILFKFLQSYYLLESLESDKVSMFISSLNSKSSISKSKNFCFFVGRSRSYNRDFQMSRHVIRKFMRFGILPGLIKERC